MKQKINNHAFVIQLEECSPSKGDVGGSSPSECTKFYFMLKEIIEQFSEESFLTIDGHDNAIIGVDENTMKLCYSMRQIIHNLMNDMSHVEALEFYDFNIAGAYMGEKTPILVNDYF